MFNVAQEREKLFWNITMASKVAQCERAIITITLIISVLLILILITFSLVGQILCERTTLSKEYSCSSSSSTNSCTTINQENMEKRRKRERWRWNTICNVQLATFTLVKGILFSLFYENYSVNGSENISHSTSHHHNSYASNEYFIHVSFILYSSGILHQKQYFFYFIFFSHLSLPN